MFIFVIFVVGLVRIVVTLLVRAVVITRAKGCGLWILAAVYGTAYQLVLMTIRWADNTAEQIDREEINSMEQEADQKEFYPIRQFKTAKEEAKPLFELAHKLFPHKCDKSVEGGEIPAAVPRGEPKE